jgi:hypothetical protein
MPICAKLRDLGIGGLRIKSIKINNFHHPDSNPLARELQKRM